MPQTSSSLPALINSQVPAFETAYGDKHLAELHARACLTAVRMNPNLANCSPQSVLGAMMTCAQLQLMPNTPQGLAYLIPYGRECQFQLGYRGLLQLMYRSGAVSSVYADVVYKGEVDAGNFSFSAGSEPSLHHTVDLLSGVRSGKDEDIVAAYASAKIKGTGAQVFRVLTRDEINKAMNQSGGKYGPSNVWKQHFPAMAMKTAIKRLCQWLPAVEMASVFEAMQEDDRQVIAATKGVAEDVAEPLEALEILNNEMAGEENDAKSE